MCAWGVNCESWDTSVDEANLEEFDYGDIPDYRFVMTTWHSDESLEDFFFFVKHSALHPSVDIERTAIIYLGSDDRRDELQAYLGDT